MIKDKRRFLYMIMVGIAISLLLKLTVYTIPQQHPWVMDYVTSILITMIVWEGNLRIDDWLNRKFPWVSRTRQRILLQLPLALLYNALTIYPLMLLYNTFICGLDAMHQHLMLVSLAISFIISFLILSFEISAQLLRGWKDSLLEVEKYKTESLMAQLKNLKDQVNPHFLFNNLSVLSSLVYKDQDKAVDFINQLSRVYRYLLDSSSNELVRLEQEMSFLESYCYLLKIRFGDNLIFIFSFPKDSGKYLIPPMALQMLIENAIKHNEISNASPLTVTINHSGNRLVVYNPVRPRQQEEASSQAGLKNIRERYRYFTEDQVEVVQDIDTFSVSIPLILAS